MNIKINEMKNIYLNKIGISVLTFLVLACDFSAQHTIAREWNEASLDAVRMDLARPTVIARNLFHTSAAMYDCWALFDEDLDTYLIGKTVDGFTCPDLTLPSYADEQLAKEEALAHVAFSILKHRYEGSSGNINTGGGIITMFEDLMTDQGYDYSNVSLDYASGDPAALGNFVASKYINFGNQDGANEASNYSNEHYLPVNPAIEIDNEDGNPNILDPNRWQPIELLAFIDQFGNNFGTTPTFLSPEWGEVSPFALQESDKTTYQRDGNDYFVYHDPQMPPLLDTTEAIGLESEYKWGFSMVSVWAAHLDPQVGPNIDISPASIGNNTAFPTDFADYDQFYDFLNGGDQSQGWSINPRTGAPYEPQMVPLGDYARVLAEFWADGPDSEAPPGHWYTILNTVMDHPDFETKWQGQGEALDQLDYEIRAYFALGGAMHDAAIAAWGIKGWYDYIRPLSAIRSMVEFGQCTDELASNYHPAGIPLIPGYIETIEMGDPLAGDANENVGKIKLFTWGGPQNITYLEPPPGPGDSVVRTPLDSAGVSWILADTWRPYQRPTFTTPPFAGYVSGHSTYSRAAAELLTLMTGDEYFPGGMGEFHCEQNNFLVFEVGPSQDLTLQWATYRDASDQCSLSRIWGGIHPPADDIPGRIIGEQVGIDAFDFANALMDAKAPLVTAFATSDNLVNDATQSFFSITIDFDESLDTNFTPNIAFLNDNPLLNSLSFAYDEWNGNQQYIAFYSVTDGNENLDNISVLVSDAQDIAGNVLEDFTVNNAFVIDTYNPSIIDVLPLVNPISDSDVGATGMTLSLIYDDEMNTAQIPVVNLPVFNDLENTLSLNEGASFWQSQTVFVAVYEVTDIDVEFNVFHITVSSTEDENGNEMNPSSDFFNVLYVDTKNPSIADVAINELIYSGSNVGTGTVQIDVIFDEIMNTGIAPDISFPVEDPLLSSLVFNSGIWLNDSTYSYSFDLIDADEILLDIDIEISNAQDANGNEFSDSVFEDFFGIDTTNPIVQNIFNSSSIITDISGNSFEITSVYSKAMDISSSPELSWPDLDPSGTLVLNNGIWIDSFTYVFEFNVVDNDLEMENIDILVSGGIDTNGNIPEPFSDEDVFSIEMLNPNVLVLTANTYNIDYSNTGPEGFTLLAIFDEEMDISQTPQIDFPVEDPSSVLTFNEAASEWINTTTYIAKYDVANGLIEYIEDIDTRIQSASDLFGNPMVILEEVDLFDISVDWTTTDITELNASEGVIAFPNPIQQGERLTIDLDNANKYALRVYSLEGKEIDADIINASSQELHLNTATWNTGVYAIHLNNEDVQLVLRVVVK